MAKKVHQKGIAAIEFAVIFPVFFLIFYAIVTYGLIFAAQQTLSLAAAEGARAAVSFQPGLGGANAQRTARIRAACDMANLSVSWLRNVGTGLGAAPVAGAGCSGGSGGPGVRAVSLQTGCPANLECVQVQINYDYGSAPLVPHLLGDWLRLPTPATLHGTAVAQIYLMD